MYYSEIHFIVKKCFQSETDLPFQIWGIKKSEIGSSIRFQILNFAAHLVQLLDYMVVIIQEIIKDFYWISKTCDKIYWQKLDVYFCYPIVRGRADEFLSLKDLYAMHIKLSEFEWSKNCLFCIFWTPLLTFSYTHCYSPVCLCTCM
jgi:hypothetical protein